jgi:NAD(P)-dependent dehydrogenase (short-subunit alcohol dehydrogenase family)
MFLAQAVARRQRRGGKQLHLLSVRAQLGLRGRGYSAYCSTKGGIVMLIRQHASELGRRGICVNGIAPPVVRTRMGAPDSPSPRFPRARVRPSTASMGNPRPVELNRDWADIGMTPTKARLTA